MAKRVSSLNTNWAFIFENVFPLDKPKILPIKMLADKYLREISAKPSELPKINWDAYRKKVTQVDKLNAIQQAYESFKVPYPSDQESLAMAEKVSAKWLEETKKYVEIITNDLKEAEEKLAELDSVMKYSEMTMEEFFMAYPKHRIDPEKPFVESWPQLLMRKMFLERLLARGAFADGTPITEEEKLRLEELIKTKNF